MIRFKFLTTVLLLILTYILTKVSPAAATWLILGGLIGLQVIN